MRQLKLTTHPIATLESKPNRAETRKGEEVLERPTKFPINPLELTCIRTIEESGEALLDLNLVEEPLLVEVGYGSLHIVVPETLCNKNGLAHAVIPVSPQVVQSPLV